MRGSTGRGNRKPAAGFPAAGFCNDHREEREISVLGRPGSDLLFQALRLSTIGAEGFNGRVRYGNGFRPPARTTRSAKNGICKLAFFSVLTIRSGLNPLKDQDPEQWALEMRTIKSIELLGPVSSTPYGAYTPGLSTWWSTTALFRENSS